MIDDRRRMRKNLLFGFGLVAMGVLFASISGAHWKRFSGSFVDAWQNHAIGWLLILMGTFVLARTLTKKRKQ